jgi:hypothetical protein
MELSEEIARKFIRGIYTCDIDGKTWTQVCSFILKMSDSLYFEKDKIHLLWTENGGHIRRKVSDDVLLLKILKLALPKYDGDDLILYRGECRFLHEQNKIGFCWTPERSVAEMFARGLNAIESGGVLLKTYAPKESVLSSPNKHSAVQMKEFEYTCDPTALTNIEVLQYFEKYSS